MKIFSKFHADNQSGFLKIIIQFVKFGIIGASNTLISLGICYLFLWIDSKFLIAGYTVGFIAGVLNAYYWNQRYVFSGAKKERFAKLIKSFVSYGATFLLGLVLLNVMVEQLSVSENIAPVLNLFVTVPLNFLLIKLWAFKEKPPN